MKLTVIYDNGAVVVLNAPEGVDPFEYAWRNLNGAIVRVDCNGEKHYKKRCS